MNAERRIADSPYMHGTSYIIDYDEDQWNRYDQAGKDFTFGQWARKAEPLGATEVVLRLCPDALFPMGEHTLPYVSERRQIVQKAGDPVTYWPLVYVDIDSLYWRDLTELQRLEVRKQARAHVLRTYGSGARFTISNGTTEIEKGKV